MQENKLTQKEPEFELAPDTISESATNTIPTITLTRKNHQYSFLRALPLKTAYFFKTARYQFMMLLHGWKITGREFPA
jgi:hypothetical protein